MSENNDFRFTDEEMKIVKNTDLPDLLEYLGYSVRRVGKRYHTTREMDSIRIKDRRTWKRYFTQQAGDSITFLQEFRGKDFREAVNYLLEFNGSHARDPPDPNPSPAQQTEKPAFTLPIPNQDQRRVFAYLCKRGIAPQVIRGFIESGLLYEDSLHHNCVFVGQDGSGKPVFASKRGTYDLNGPGFKGDATGSDESVAFRLPCDPALDWVAVFEAPIDLMSFCILHRRPGRRGRSGPERQLHRNHLQQVRHRLYGHSGLHRRGVQGQLRSGHLHRYLRQR